MKDLALANGDLKIADFDFALVDAEEQLLQSMAIRLRFFRGEWYLDTDAGLPYLTDIMVKGPETRSHVEALFKRAILNTPGVTGLKSFGMSFDAAQRTLKIEFSAESVYGQISNAEVLLNG